MPTGDCNRFGNRRGDGEQQDRYHRHPKDQHAEDLPVSMQQSISLSRQSRSALRDSSSGLFFPFHSLGVAWRPSDRGHDQMHLRQASLPGDELDCAQLRSISIFERQLMKAILEQPNPEYRLALPDRGAPYPIDGFELQDIQDPTFGSHMLGWRPFPESIHMQAAAKQLFSNHPIKQTQEWRDAWRRILGHIEMPLTWDLLVKMFNDLDIILFHGDLRRRVCLKWVDMRLCGMPRQLGYTHCPMNWNTHRITIIMSSDTEWRQFPPEYALGVLLHEMLHAYFAVWCGHDTIEIAWEPDQHPGHGIIFMAAARRMERLVAVDMTSHPQEFEHPMFEGGVPFSCINVSMNRLGRR